MVNISEPQMSAYLHAKAKQKGVPLAGSFELTSKCNFNCPMCYVHEHSTVDSLSAEDYMSITDEACNAGMLFLLLSGGEPLLRDDFEKIYTHAHKKGLIISINTNGFLIDRYIDLFKLLPPVRVNISLYGGDDDGYIRQCGSRAFDKVTDNIKKLKEMNISVKLNTVITRANATELDKIISTAKMLGVPVQMTPYCYPQVRTGGGYGENAARLSPEEAGKYSVMGDILLYGEEEFIKKNGLSHKSVGCGDDDCRIKCRAGSSSFWITYDGKMRACAMMDKPSADIKEIGFSAAWEQIKAETLKLRTPHECADCPDAMFCRACAAMCYCETGATDKRPDYVCRMIRSIRNNTEDYLKKQGESK